MEYYNLLNLKKEPFSNSPEPEFLFQSNQHAGCLQKLELAIRLRRGLNVIIGDVGTGKTTLCRKLIQGLSSAPKDSESIEPHLLLDPSFNSPLEFLQNVALMLGVKGIEGKENEWQLKEKIKDYLFIRGVTEGKIIVLVIDEGQKIAESCLEILREFLNYETNDCKLLQIVIFAQREFNALLKKHANLTDRINIIYYLKPLNFAQTRAMIRYRIAVARNLENGPALFSFGALLAIYLSTGGYPRKIVSLCHQVILMLIIRRKQKAGYIFVRRCLNEMMTPLFKKMRWGAISFLVVIAIVFLAAGLFLHYQNINLFEKRVPVRAVNLEDRKTTSKSAVAAAAEIIPAPVTAPVAIAEDEKYDSKMPESLGTLPLRKGGTLWWMLQNVYGDSSPEIMRAIVSANSRIININRIVSGTQIILPSLPSEMNPLKNGDFLVQIRAGKNLTKEYNYFRENSHRRLMPETVFLTYWNKKEGMTYSIVLDRCFNNNETALKEIKKLPVAIAANTKVLSHWDEGTIFFSRHSFKCSGIESSGG
jgi:general secretion pathway protein A